MSAIALKLKNHAENRREHGFFQEIAKAYRENQAVLGSARTRQNLHDPEEIE